MHHDYKYDVCLSFASEQREYVKELNDILIKNGIKTFYDDEKRAALWGKNLQTELYEVYHNQSKYCILFLSESYSNKPWTNYEKETALSRALTDKDYILCVRFDDTEFSGILNTVRFENGNDIKPKDLANLILKKLDISKPILRLPRLRTKADKIQERNIIFFYLIEQIEKMLLQIPDIEVKKEKNSNFDEIFRFYYDSNILLILRIHAIDDKIYLNIGNLIPNDDNYNGVIIINSEYNDTGRIEFINIGFFDELDHNEYITKDKLFELIWEQICLTIELLLN